MKRTTDICLRSPRYIYVLTFLSCDPSVIVGKVGGGGVFLLIDHPLWKSKSFSCFTLPISTVEYQINVTRKPEEEEEENERDFFSSSFSFFFFAVKKTRVEVFFSIID